jgi:moderate conductance mechanosensitive channel
MPDNWPALILALSLALAAAYIIADLVARAVHSMLRAIVTGEHDALLVHRPRRLIHLFIFLIVAAALVLPALSFAGYSTRFGGDAESMMRWLLNAGLRIAVIAVAAYMAIRIGSAAAQRFEREMGAGTGLDVIERTKRARTLGRLLQNTLSIVVSVIAALMALREFGVDITPALTGAGIAGVALGFGAQTLVRDIISGFFIILEDQVRVGDVAVVNGQGGLIEEVNLRTIVLRDEQGTVHVFPNGDVKTLANMSKDFSYYVITVGIGYDDDPDRVAAVMAEAGATLMADPEFRPHILEPLEIYGVDAFEPGQIVMKARIKTVPLKQWLVGRELRKRIARLFREHGIQIPVPHMELHIDRADERLTGRPDSTRRQGDGGQAATEG